MKHSESHTHTHTGNRHTVALAENQARDRRLPKRMCYPLRHFGRQNVSDGILRVVHVRDKKHFP